ncbi:MAG: response regulator [Proteobacteria bacterium]|nr:response regulator [Pseudomonadota bacterium]
MYKIIIVEDDSIVAMDLQELVVSFGYDVVGVFPTAEQVLESYKDLAPDLLLVDITLAGKMDGITLVKELGKETNIPIIYLTAHYDENTIAKATETKPYSYVLKPYKEVELKVALQIALYRHYGKEQILESESSSEALDAPSDVEQQSNIEKFLQSIPTFSKLSNVALRDLAKDSKLLTISTGSQIFRNASMKEQFSFIVKKGRVAMSRTSSTGRVLIVELLGPKDLFAIFSDFGAVSSNLLARVQVDSEIILIPKQNFIRFLSDAPDYYRLILTEINDRLKNSYEISRTLAHERVETRIAYVLAKILPKFTEYHSDMQTDVIPITRQEIADLVGTTVETAIRVTRNLEDDKIIELPSPGIIKVLNQERLEEIIK